MRRVLLFFGVGAILAALLLLWPPPPDAIPTVEPEALEAALAPADLPISAAETDVILAVTCTLRRDRLQAYGNPRPTSPFSARLASSGVVFDSHFAQAPWTRPSIGSILTGRYPRVLRLDNPNEGDQDFTLVMSDAFTTAAEALSAAGYRTIGAVGNPNAKKQFGLGQGFDAYSEPDDTFNATLHDDMPRGDDLVDFVLDEIRATPADQRIFAQLVFVDPHAPEQYAPRYLMLWPRIWTSLDAFRLDTYDASVRNLDGILARLLTEVRAMRPNSLYVQVADHGEGLNHPTPRHTNGHGRTLYQSVIRLPHLWQHPALPARRVDTNTRNIDVLPSLLAVLGLSLDWAVDGASYDAVLTDADATLAPRQVFTETFYRQASKRGMVDGQWHVIENRHTGRQELYQKTDTAAADNLIKTHPDIASAMLEQIDAWEVTHQAIAEQNAAQSAELDEATRELLETMGYLE